VRGLDSAEPTRQNARDRGKGATQHVRVRFAAPGACDESLGSSASPSVGSEGVRVSFHPLASTVDSIMEVRLKFIIYYMYKFIIYSITQTTGQEVARVMGDPSLYSEWNNFVNAKEGSKNEGERESEREEEGEREKQRRHDGNSVVRSLYMKSKDEEGGVWLLDPLALVANYGVENEVLILMND
jgi:hypothetical protein